MCVILTDDNEQESNNYQGNNHLHLWGDNTAQTHSTHNTLQVSRVQEENGATHTFMSLHHIRLCSCLARLLKADALSDRLSARGQKEEDEDNTELWTVDWDWSCLAEL